MSATVTIGSNRIAITILHPDGTGHGVRAAELDGDALLICKNGVPLPLLDGSHQLIVTLGPVAGQAESASLD